MEIQLLPLTSTPRDASKKLPFRVAILSAAILLLASPVLAQGPQTSEEAKKPQGPKFVFGATLSFPHSHSDFEVTNGALVLIDDSRLRASGFVGVALPLWRELESLVSFEFTQGTSKALDGILFGGVYRLKPWLGVMAGYSRRREAQLRPGFKAAAKSVIGRQQRVGDDKYTRFPASLDDPRHERDWDGLPLVDPNQPDRAFYPAHPTYKPYTNKWHVGIVIPIDISIKWPDGT